MSLMVGEKILEAALSTRAMQLHCLSLKFVSPQYSGVPDRLVIGFGMCWFAEVKTTGVWPGGPKKFARQKFVHKEFLRFGFQVWIVDDWNSLDRFIEHIKKQIDERRITSLSDTLH